MNCTADGPTHASGRSRAAAVLQRASKPRRRRRLVLSRGTGCWCFSVRRANLGASPAPRMSACACYFRVDRMRGALRKGAGIGAAAGFSRESSRGGRVGVCRYSRGHGARSSRPGRPRAARCLRHRARERIYRVAFDFSRARFLFWSAGPLVRNYIFTRL
jgi:hypothetical protein